MNKQKMFLKPTGLNLFQFKCYQNLISEGIDLMLYR